MMVHGTSRAAGMREVAAAVEPLGLPARMGMATVDWQEQIVTREESHDAGKRFALTGDWLVRP